MLVILKEGEYVTMYGERLETQGPQGESRFSTESSRNEFQLAQVQGTTKSAKELSLRYITLSHHRTGSGRHHCAHLYWALGTAVCASCPAAPDAG